MNRLTQILNFELKLNHLITTTISFHIDVYLKRVYSCVLIYQTTYIIIITVESGKGISISIRIHFMSKRAVLIHHKVE